MTKKVFRIVVLLLFSLGLQAQEKVAFNGILCDMGGKPISKAHVWVRSARDYALTDRGGRFGLTNVGANDTLRIEVKKRRYTVPVGGKRSMRIRLYDEHRIEAMEDQQLVDVGFGFVSRREHTGVSNYISGDELRRSGSADVISALQGRVPGLNITGTSGYGGANQKVNIRGERSFTADSTPLFIIDSTVVPDFSGINLFDVDYVEILKDASAYGSNGANGAIVVHTKMARPQ